MIDYGLLSPPDILLHHSGHIMLSDFDLAKHSGVNGGRPAVIHQSALNGVILCPFVSVTTWILMSNSISFLWLTPNHARLIFGPIRLWGLKVGRSLILLI